MGDNEILEIDASYSAFVEALRSRARNVRKYAQVLIMVNIAIVIAILVFFFSKSTYQLNTNLASTIEFSGLGLSFKSKQAIETPNSNPETLKEINEELGKLKQQNKLLEQQVNERAFLMNTIGETILRFGSVLLAVYLIQILVNFTRYHFRISDHLFSVADSIELCKGDMKSLDKIVDILSPRHIDFGASPKSINDNVTAIIKDTISKIPNASK